MPNLLDTDTLAVIKAAIKDVVDTFFRFEITINHREQVRPNNYGESVAATVTSHKFNALYQYTVASDGRYITVQRSEKGQELHDGWRVYLWKDDVAAAGLTINPESDTVTIDGKTYEIRMFTPSAPMSDLGNLFYEFDVHFN
jgi:sulfur transfer complex TusBCD TusB component (DsrH family)